MVKDGELELPKEVAQMVDGGWLGVRWMMDGGWWLVGRMVGRMARGDSWDDASRRKVKDGWVVGKDGGEGWGW